MLSMESMIAISSRRGGGGRQTFPVPLSRRNKKLPCVGADAHIGPLKRTHVKNMSLRGRTAPVAIRNTYPAPRLVCKRPRALTNIVNK